MAQIDIAALRWQNQCIQTSRFERPEDAVQWMGALQAQDYSHGVWAVGLRTRAATLAGVERAIAAGKLLRIWPLRGTLHFVAAEDARWMLDLSGARTLAAARGRHAQLGLGVADFSRSQHLMAAALQGAKRLTRAQMMQLLEQGGVSTAGQRGIHILGQAALCGLICYGPKDGKQETFVLLDEFAAPGRTLAREEALAELAGRYFASHGPATVRDFTWWAGLTLADARAGLAGAVGLTSITIDSTEYWLAADTLDRTSPTVSGVQLLPGFDEYLIGYAGRSAVIRAENMAKVSPGANGLFYPVLAVGGQISGTWKRTLKKGSLALSLQPFMPLDVSADLINAAADRYSRFLELPLEALTVADGPPG
jgi:hypothetical protein